MWQRNLAHLVHFSSDAAVFILQRMTLEGQIDQRETSRCIADICELGLPFTGEAFGLLFNLLPSLAERSNDRRVEALSQRVAEINRFFRPDGLFLCLKSDGSSDTQQHLGELLLASL